MTGAIAGLGNALDVQKATADGLYQNVEPGNAQGQSSSLMSGPDTVQISDQGRAALNASIPAVEE